MNIWNPFKRTEPAEAEASDHGAAPAHNSLENFLFGDTGVSFTLHLPRITEMTLLKIPAAYDAINVLVRPIKTLPLVFFERNVVKGENGQDKVVKERLSDNDVQELLKSPNGWQDRLEFIEFVFRSLVTFNNSYIEQVMIDGEIELWPHHANTITVRWRRGKVWYEVRDGGNTRIIPEERMWHIKVGPFDDKGIVGIGPLVTNQEIFQSALAVIEYGGRFFGNDASPSGGYWKAPEGLSDQARKNMETSLKGALGGPNQHRTIVAEEGLEHVTVNIPNDKAQFLETKKHDAIEIARIYSVPPHKIKSLENATFSNIEQQAIEFVVYSLAPWLTAFESSLKTLIGLDNNVFAEFNVLGLLRGDTKARFESYAIARQWGWMSVDDIRALENSNPLPNGQGETYLTPLNMSDTANDNPEN